VRHIGSIGGALVALDLAVRKPPHNKVVSAIVRAMLQ
jgi:hypothetical protein